MLIFLIMWKFFCIFVKLLQKMDIVMNVKSVSEPMNVEYTYTNLYITNLTVKSHKL
jgi:hypothetical protein